MRFAKKASVQNFVCQNIFDVFFTCEYKFVSNMDFILSKAPIAKSNSVCYSSINIYFPFNSFINWNFCF